VSYEIRLNEDGSLDAVVAASPKHFHLEQIARDAWWICVDMPDGTQINVKAVARRQAGQGAGRGESVTERPAPSRCLYRHGEGGARARYRRLARSVAFRRSESARKLAAYHARKAAA
jgi:hypothetical protein